MGGFPLNGDRPKPGGAAFGSLTSSGDCGSNEGGNAGDGGLSSGLDKTGESSLVEADPAGA